MFQLHFRQIFWQQARKLVLFNQRYNMFVSGRTSCKFHMSWKSTQILNLTFQGSVGRKFEKLWLKALRGWSSYLKAKPGFSMANYRKSTNFRTKFCVWLMYLSKNLASYKKIESDGWLVQSETCKQKWRNYFFKMYLLPGFKRSRFLDHPLKGLLDAFKDIKGGDTFWKNNFVIFVSMFLIGRAIRHFRLFLGCKIFV